MDAQKKFDSQVKTYEKLRDSKKDFARERLALLRNISGNVLEIAPGPGFNFPYYGKASHLTAVDLSPQMLKSAETYWHSLSTIPSTFIASDIMEVSLKAQQFDFVISTCSLCAYTDPVAVLNRLATWCKPEGTIYLLEHGLSDNRIVRAIQHLYEPIHYRQHACHCNRDIRAIVEASNLDIVSLHKPRPYAPIDFLYSVVARPKQA